MQDLDLRLLTKLSRFSFSLVLTFTLLAFSACGTSTASKVETPPNVSEQEEPVENVGTSGRLIFIESDNVNMAGYDAASKVLTIQFDSGALYEYYGIPAEFWVSFLAAQPHPWSQVGYPQLVLGEVPYRRIG